MQREAFSSLDENLVIEDTIDIPSVTNQSSDIMELDYRSDEDAEEVNNMKLTAYQQAIDMVKQLKKFSQNRRAAAVLELLSTLELHYHEQNNKKTTRQTTLLSYFTMLH
ncbi:hypothetical protein QE152_g30125 [Popillia japonica]|uniref:Uncharacterized protein n=1 Tax=Popillia japonica TaxID=7064 RepID=A0AAW1JFA2_POPJA